LKTLEEHNKINEILSRNNHIPHRSKQGCFPTTGIMYCKKCCHRMVYSIGRKEAKSGIAYDYTKCSHKNPFGDKCPQRGVKMNDAFYNALYNQLIDNYLDETRLMKITDENGILGLGMNNEVILLKKSELQQAEKESKKLLDAYYADAFTTFEFAKMKKAQDDKIRKIKLELEKLEEVNPEIKQVSKVELKMRIANFKKSWQKAITSKQKNILLKSIVNKIYYDRDGNNVTFEIEYL